MTIVRCPRCRDEVVVPAKATGRALVRCPLCLEEYLLAEALANAPPPLVIIGGEVEPSMIDAASDGSEYQLAGGSFAPETLHSATSSIASSAAVRPTVRSLPRPRRKEMSGLVLLVNYILGGALGLTLGVVVLWWLGRDPLDLGPRVAAYAPWIVPQPFQGKSASSDAPTSSAPESKPAKNKRGSSTPYMDPGPRESSAELQTVPGLDEPARLPDRALTPTIGAPKLNDQGASSKAPMPDLTELLPDGPFVVQPPAATSTPVPTATELADAVKAAEVALTRYEQIPRDESETARQAFIDLYDAASEVGRLISYRNAGDPELSDPVARMQELLDALSGARGVSRLRPIKFLTAQRWPEQSSGQGLLAAGTVKAFHPRGSLYEVALDASVRDESAAVPLVTAKNPRDLCQVGDELLVLGRVVEQPNENLAGYGGDQPRVLLLGYAVRVPKAD